MKKLSPLFPYHLFELNLNDPGCEMHCVKSKKMIGIEYQEMYKWCADNLTEYILCFWLIDTTKKQRLASALNLNSRHRNELPGTGARKLVDCSFYFTNKLDATKFLFAWGAIDGTD